MDDYKILETIGDGSFGVVSKAIHLKTGDQVAIKRIKKKFSSWDECLSLRELKSLRKLTHQNIVKLRECLKVKDELYFVFELMEQNVFQLYNNQGKILPEHQIKTVLYHAFSGLAYMHKQGFFHRDLKPENLLITNGITKISDFGLAREIRSRPPYTDYVATRWYRAPEILLKQPNYNSPVDIFALGCIMAELYLSEPLFKGNSELEQMYKICSVLGTPTTTTWNEGLKLAASIGFTFPQLPPVNLATLIPRASEDAIQLMTELLKLDPQKRPSAQQVLQHPYFAGFVPDDKPFAAVDQYNIGKKGFTANNKVADINDADHLDILNELGLEKTVGKENVDWDPTPKKGEKEKDRGDWDAKPSEDDNAENLLAEIEEYMNSDIGKKEGMPFNSKTGGSYGGYGAMGGAGQKDSYGSNYRASSMSVPGNYGADGGWGAQMGPSTYDLLQKNANNLSGNAAYNYGAGNQYGGNTGAGNDNMYKFGNAGAGGNQWGSKANMSNKGATIMNTFVSSNSSKNLNANVGLTYNTNTGVDSYGKYGY